MPIAILTAFMVFCLFYGRIAIQPLLAISASLGIFLALTNRHSHSRFLAVDVYAQSSKLNGINAALKFGAAVLLLILCVASESPAVGVYLSLVMFLLIVAVNKVHLYEYIRLLSLPVSFLILSGLALLFEINKQPTGILNIRFFGLWLCINAEAQMKTALVMARSLGAISCLYMLGLTTPMSEIISVLRRIRCPGVIVSLMYLTYRYIFILLIMYDTMKSAAKSRLGYRDYFTSIRTTGGIYANLFSRSYRYATMNYDAMVSRGFETEIRFLEKKNKIYGKHVAVALGIIMITLAITIYFK